jgi:hypothetical protein
MSDKDPLISDVQFNNGYIDNDEVSEFLFRIQNKYSNNAEKKQLKQLYDIGLKISNRNFNRDKLINILTKLIDKGSQDSIQKVREYKRKKLLEAFKKGVSDGLDKIHQYR